jgi:hypothetical protein
MDPIACDYDPSATLQAYGEFEGETGLSFSWTPGSWDSEVSWDIGWDGDAYYGAAGDEPTLDLAEGTYTICGYDAYGDGWNGGELVITDNASGNSVSLAVVGDQTCVEITVTGPPALCDYLSCAGCTDSVACNYIETATIEDGSCEYESYDIVDCDNVCLDGGVLYEFNVTDAYSDGMCCGYGEGYLAISVEGEEVFTASDFGASASYAVCAPADACVQLSFVSDSYPGEQDWTMSADGVDVGYGDGSDATYNYGVCNSGCMDAEACNYDEVADLDDGSCTYVDPTPIPSSCEGGSAPACGLFFSGYAEGSSNNKFLEIYNPTDEDISLDGFAYPSVSNAPSVPGEHEYWNAFDEGAVVAAGDVYVIAHGSADPAILAEADEFHTYLSNGDDGYALVEGDESGYVIVDMIGTWDADPGSGWEVAGVANGTKDHSLIRKSDVNSGNSGYWAASAGTNTDDSEWIVLDQNDWTGLGAHDFTGSCEAVSEAVVYDCDGNCLADSDGDGVCNELEVGGCQDYTACNFCEEATDEDGSCEWSSCGGCTDPLACNYFGATFDDGSCWYENDDCHYCGQFEGDPDSLCEFDLNLNGICDCNEVLGCTYVFSCNYDPSANIDDGSCEIDSCACPGDLNDDGEVDVSDLLDFFQLWGNVCE